MTQIMPGTPGDTNPTERLRLDILAGLQAAEDSSIGDMTPEELLDAYRAEEFAKAAADTWRLRERLFKALTGPAPLSEDEATTVLDEFVAGLRSAGERCPNCGCVDPDCDACNIDCATDEEAER